MALPPTIPTSFTPKSPAAVVRRNGFDFLSAFGVLTYVVLAVVVSMALGVFIYERMLATDQSNKDTELKEAKAKIDTAMAESFVRLSTRLTTTKSLLDSHVTLSKFFAEFGLIIPHTVRFSTLQVTAADGKKAVLTGAGTAKNFNALASASGSFSRNANIKNAIFSHLTINKDNSVGFSVTAEIDDKLIRFTAPEAVVVPTPVATSTASTTTP